MHGLADLVIPSETERYIRNPTTDLGVRQIRFDPACGIDEVNRVVIVLLHAGRYGENIGIEDDVFRGEADLVD